MEKLCLRPHILKSLLGFLSMIGILLYTAALAAQRSRNAGGYGTAASKWDTLTQSTETISPEPQRPSREMER
jgi:hypothetical protein